MSKAPKCVDGKNEDRGHVRSRGRRVVDRRFVLRPLPNAEVVHQPTTGRIAAEIMSRLAGSPLNKPIMGDVERFKPKQKPGAASGYKMVNKGSDRGEIYLYGIIGVDWFGDGVSAKQFASDLKALGTVKTIDLRINSDGGVVTDARAMHTLLMEHPADIITHIDGIAASAASFLAMAGKEIRIAEGGFMMIHNARMMAYGEADDMRHAATVLDTVNETIRNTYQKRSGAKPEDIKKWMDAETWWNGKEAVANGFADKIVEDMKVAACIHDPTRFKNMPAALRPNRAAAIAALDRMKAPLR